MVVMEVFSENKFVSLFVIVLFISVVCDISVVSGEDAPVLCVGVTGDNVSIK